ncbi:S-(2-succino)cysteine N-acetyltransferase [Ureibacillus acetophenoni]
MTFHFRQATVDDAKTLQEILVKAYAENGKLGIKFDAVNADVEMTTRHLQTNLCFFMEYEGKVVATISLRMPWSPNPGPEKVPHIGWFATDPDSGQKGLGSKLLTWLEEEVLKNRLRTPYVTLGTADKHPWLIQMYERKGYKVFSQKDLGKGHITIYMKKEFNLED